MLLSPPPARSSARRRRAIELGEDGSDVYFLRGEAYRVLDLRTEAIADCYLEAVNWADNAVGSMR